MYIHIFSYNSILYTGYTKHTSKFVILKQVYVIFLFKYITGYCYFFELIKYYYTKYWKPQSKKSLRTTMCRK